MKNHMLVTGVMMAIFYVTHLNADGGLSDAELGLSKTSVFETPSPEPFNYSGDMPFGNALLPRAYPGAPPQIPHKIEPMLPVTAKSNFCLGCHESPEKMGQQAKGQATPMPASHYTDLRHTPGEVEKKVIGARYVCTQCHVPQADAKALVNNTFD